MWWLSTTGSNLHWISNDQKRDWCQLRWHSVKNTPGLILDSRTSCVCASASGDLLFQSCQRLKIWGLVLGTDTLYWYSIGQLATVAAQLASLIRNIVPSLHEKRIEKKKHASSIFGMLSVLRDWQEKTQQRILHRSHFKKPPRLSIEREKRGNFDSGAMFKKKTTTCHSFPECLCNGGIVYLAPKT